MSAPIEGLIAQAAAESATVTVVLKDSGVALTGTLRLHPLLLGAYQLERLGRDGRIGIYPDDVQEVIFE